MEKISAVREFVAILMAFLFLLPSVGEAKDIEVDCAKHTIQERLKHADSGDTLLVRGPVMKM